MFSAQTYQNRRANLKKQMSAGLLFFMGNDECGMNYAGNTYHFRQDSTFLYYFGIKRPGLYAIIDLDTGEEIIYGNDYTIDDIFWMGDMPLLKDMAEQVGINHTGKPEDLVRKLHGRQDVHYLPPYRSEHQLKLWELLGILPSEAQQRSSIPFILAVAQQRNIKSVEEIAAIEEAVNITVSMHQAAMRFARVGMVEAEIAARVTQIALQHGGQLSFPVIATINGQTLHNHYHGNRLREGDLFLLDAGAETPMGYAGDMSSTFPVSRKFSPMQRDIYQICLDAHNAAIDLLKPDLHFREAHLLAAEKIFEGLKSLGLTKGNTQDAVHNGAHALFFPCGLGHLMGLDVHDMENLGEQWVGYNGQPKSTQFGLKSLRLGMPLKAGHVLTIEPGIYFIPHLIDLWQAKGINREYLNFDVIQAFRNFGGIRNEEDILITPDGHRILGLPLAKTIEDVEAERALAWS